MKEVFGEVMSKCPMVIISIAAYLLLAAIIVISRYWPKKNGKETCPSCLGLGWHKEEMHSHARIDCEICQGKGYIAAA